MGKCRIGILIILLQCCSYACILHLFQGILMKIIYVIQAIRQIKVRRIHNSCICLLYTSLAAMDATCNMDVQAVPGMKNMLFGGEGIFNTVVTGPGRIWLQTMPISNVAGAIRPYIPTSK